MEVESRLVGVYRLRGYRVPRGGVSSVQSCGKYLPCSSILIIDCYYCSVPRVSKRIGKPKFVIRSETVTVMQLTVESAAIKTNVKTIRDCVIYPEFHCMEVLYNGLRYISLEL